MVQDSQQQANRLYIICMICLVLSLFLIAFSLYIMPVVFWQVNYDIPEFVMDLRETLIEDYNYQPRGADWFMILIFLIPGVIAGMMATIITRVIDGQAGLVRERVLIAPTPLPAGEEEGAMSTVLKVLILIVVVIGAVFFSEWFFSATL